MKISQTWRYTRPFMTSFANEDISLHVPRSGIIGVQSNRKINAIDLLHFYRQNYGSLIKDLTPLSEVSTQRKIQILEALPLEEQNLDITSEDAIKNMQIEYEKPGTTFVFGYPTSVEEARKLENYCGGLNLYLNLNFGDSFLEEQTTKKYVTDEMGSVYDKEIYRKVQKIQQTELDYYSEGPNEQEQLDSNEKSLDAYQGFAELQEIQENQPTQKLESTDSKTSEKLLDFYDKRGILIDININKSQDMQKVLMNLTERMVRMFKY